MKKLALTATILTLGLAACGSPDTVDEVGGDPAAPGAELGMDAGDLDSPRRAVAELRTAEGELVGNVAASTTLGDERILVSLEVEGLSPGQRGVHIHTVGSCDAPTFQSAGDHWNPTGAQHGLDNPEGQHAGDMPNLEVAEDGRGTLEYRLEEGTFDGLLDEDGSAFVVHAGPDDQVTDPSGNSGDRIACGVFEAES